MFSRCISIFVIVGFVASQLAAVPHLHSWSSFADQQQHDATPHLHLDWLGFSDHSHEHSHGGQTHSHCHIKHSHAAPVEDHNDSACVSDSGDHDASAVAVSVPEGMPSSGSYQLPGKATSQLLAAAIPLDGSIELNGLRPIRWHPPDLAWSDAHLYIFLRNLRL